MNQITQTGKSLCKPNSATSNILAPYILWSGVLERSFEADYWSGVESDFGVAKVEWSCDVSVCVYSWSTQILRSKTPLHRIHGADYFPKVLSWKEFSKKSIWQKNMLSFLACKELSTYSLVSTLYIPIVNFSVMSGRVFLGWTSTKQRIKCLAQGHNIVTPPRVRLKPATLPSPVWHSTNWATALRTYMDKSWNCLKSWFFKFQILKLAICLQNINTLKFKWPIVYG